MAYGEPNCHMTEDVTWWWMVKFQTPMRYPNAIYRKQLEIETPFQRTKNRKWPTGNRMVTWSSVTSWGPYKSSRDPNTLKAQYLENSWRCYLATIGNYYRYRPSSFGVLLHAVVITFLMDTCKLATTQFGRFHQQEISACMSMAPWQWGRTSIMYCRHPIALWGRSDLSCRRCHHMR